VRGPKIPAKATYAVTALMIRPTRSISARRIDRSSRSPPSRPRESGRFDAHLKETMRRRFAAFTCRGVSLTMTAQWRDNRGEYCRPAKAARPAAGREHGPRSHAIAGVPQNIRGRTKPRPAIPIRGEPQGRGERHAAPEPGLRETRCSPDTDGRMIALSAATGTDCQGFGGGK